MKIRIFSTKLTTISSAPDGALQKIGLQNGDLVERSKNKAPEVWDSRWGMEQCEKKKILYLAPQCCVVQEFLRGSWKICQWHPICPKANNKNGKLIRKYK